MHCSQKLDIFLKQISAIKEDQKLVVSILFLVVVQRLLTLLFLIRNSTGLWGAI
jgi:hypothetical protein